VGNFHFSPNIEAVEYLLNEIMPEIPEHILRDHPISIVGSGLDEKVSGLGKGLNDVRMVGWVPDVAVYLHQARVSVIPLLYGAGIKGKLLNALAAGTPSVSTSIGAEGLGLIRGEHILVADDAAAFAASIVSLIGDKTMWERLARQGHNHINATHGHQAVQERFMNAIASVMSRVDSGKN
jgi:glycosyltransferase involved in cell wall biosynthesis